MRELALKIFYGPGDWLARQTDVRTRRAINAWILIVWLVPGTAIWLYIPNALWFVGFMSIFALWWTGWGAVGTETPVEIESEEVEVEHADEVHQK